MKTPRNPRSTQPTVRDTHPAKKPSSQQVGAGSAGSPRRPTRTQPTPNPSVSAKATQPVKKSRLAGCLTTLGILTTLLTATGTIVGGIWLGVLLMINPNAVVWLNKFLPQWTRIPIAAAAPPQSLAAIQDGLRKSGFIPGETLTLSNSELLLPILAASPACSTDCSQIVELRVYQPESQGDQNYYRLVTQLPVSGPQEYFVLSSLAKTDPEKAETSRSLPLTKLNPLDEKAPAPGFWFGLSGQRLGGDSPMTYGEVIHYNPERAHLSVMVQWTTPNELEPYWQQVTGTSTPELVVNQSANLEPQFKVYQIKPRNFVPDPIYLEEISLVDPALDTSTYRDALMLARNGLWSSALQWLQSQKKKNWSVAAQAQMDVIQLHAQVTASQAQQAWPTPSSAILANLIDGRWANALLVFQSADFLALQDIATLLKADSGGLWGRVEAALKVYPKDNNVKAWGALILTAQQGPAKAIAWLKQFSPPSTLIASQETKETPDTNDPIYQLLDRLDAALSEASFTSGHLSQIVGTAQPAANVNPSDWLLLESENPSQWQQGKKENTGTQGRGNRGSLPTASPRATTSPLPPATKPTSPSPTALPPTLQLDAQQVWYQIQVGAFNDGQHWRRTPFPDLQLPKLAQARQLWKYLGLNTDPHIQITVWTTEGQQESIVATVKAVSYRGGTIQLLAAGEPLPAARTADSALHRSRLLAYTDSAVRWIEPGAIALSELNKVQPQWVSAILPTLWRELAKSGKDLIHPIYRTAGVMPSPTVMLGEMGQWSVRPVDVTGDNKPDAVLTLYEDLSGAIKKPGADPLDTGVPAALLYKPRTMIFSDTGALLYSEFSQNANSSLTAIADLGDNGALALVINNQNTYSLKRWSEQHKRFE
ncbi:MAG TPA: hypothetical protein V6D50_18800 [Chroococcales cyanobacterium]